MKLSLKEKDFQKIRNFQDTFNKQLGDRAYVGTDYATLFVEYSPQLKAMLRPSPTTLNYEFELLCLTCEKCKKNQPFLALLGESTFLCDDCLAKPKK